MRATFSGILIKSATRYILLQFACLRMFRIRINFEPMRVIRKSMSGAMRINPNHFEKSFQSWLLKIA